MKTLVRTLTFCAAAGAVAIGTAPRSHAAAAPSIAGKWTLDREHSMMPDDIGFNVVASGVAVPPETSAAASAGRSGGGRGGGGRSGSSGTSVGVSHVTEQTLKITTNMTDEAEHPWTTLVIAVTDAQITIGNGADITRTFRVGKDDEQRLADGGIETHSKWEKGAFLVDYEIEKDRDVRYAYSRASDTAPLSVSVSFRDHGHGDVVSRVYQVNH